MNIFQTIVSPTLGVLEVAGAASGIPYAQGAGLALQIINTACNQVAIHKVGLLIRVNDNHSLQLNTVLSPLAQICATC
jgi:hypothetical protein